MTTNTPDSGNAPAHFDDDYTMAEMRRKKAALGQKVDP